MALLLKHQTVEGLVSRIRARYKDSSPQEVVTIARFLINRISTGDLTDAQLRTAFGKSAAQWTSLKNKMTSLVNADNSVRAATGE